MFVTPVPVADTSASTVVQAEAGWKSAAACVDLKQPPAWVMVWVPILAGYMETVLFRQIWQLTDPPALGFPRIWISIPVGKSGLPVIRWGSVQYTNRPLLFLPHDTGFLASGS